MSISLIDKIILQVIPKIKYYELIKKKQQFKWEARISDIKNSLPFNVQENQISKLEMKRKEKDTKDYYSLQQKKSRYPIKPKLTQSPHKNFNSTNLNNAEQPILEATFMKRAIEILKSNTNAGVIITKQNHLQFINFASTLQKQIQMDVEDFIDRKRKNTTNRSIINKKRNWEQNDEQYSLQRSNTA